MDQYFHPGWRLKVKPVLPQLMSGLIIDHIRYGTYISLNDQTSACGAPPGGNPPCV